MSAAVNQNPETTPAVESENAAAPLARPRAPWQPPRLTRFPLARTELGGTIGNEGNGVFAFTETC